jgi:uncharacterized phage protein (TIGR01671 family)
VREYKFRGKRVDNGEWVHGSLHTIQGDPYIIAKDTGHFSISHGEEIFITAYIEAVDPATVGQYTGIHDKEGREVYEGDILRCADGVTGKVEWQEGIAWFCLVWEENDRIFGIHRCSAGIPRDCKVIGNIHEGDLLPKEA